MASYASKNGNRAAARKNSLLLWLTEKCFYTNFFTKFLYLCIRRTPKFKAKKGERKCVLYMGIYGN